MALQHEGGGWSLAPLAGGGRRPSPEEVASPWNSPRRRSYNAAQAAPRSRGACQRRYCLAARELSPAAALAMVVEAAVLQRSICSAARWRRSFDATSMALLAGERAATQHPWCCSPAADLQRNSHGASSHHPWRCSPATELQRISDGASTQHPWRCSPATKLQRSIHGARPKLQSSFDRAPVLRWSSVGVASNEASPEPLELYWGCNGARPELQWSSPERHCCAGASSGCNGAHRRPLVLSWSFPLGLQWRCVEAVTLAAACCNPTLPSILIRRLNRRMISLRNHPADL